MRRRVWLLLSLLLSLACSLPVVVVQPTPTPTITPPPAASATPRPPTPTLTPTASPLPTVATDGLELQREAMRSTFADDLESLSDLSQYWIDVHVSYDPTLQQASMDGTARVLFTNPLDRALTDLVLMLWPNDEQYLASMTAGPVTIEGTTVEPVIELDGLALRAQLPRLLLPGATLDLSVPFQVQDIPAMRASAPHRFCITEGVLIAPTFYPLIPRLVDGDWQVEAAPPGGDTTNSDVALYTVRVTFPTGIALVASGTETDRQANGDGTETATFVTGPMRDFALALGPLQLQERAVAGTLLRAWVLPEHASDSARMLNAAAGQLLALTEAVGPYPYAELDLVDAPDAYSGIEYPGLVFIGTLGTRHVVAPVVHEIAHQWFYGLVGNDQLLDPWLDEGAASYSEALYYETAVSPERATTVLDEFRGYVDCCATDRDLPIGLPLGEYASEQDYNIIVYAKGALFFDALRREIGDQAFFGFLRAYFQDYHYRLATPADFQAEAEQACSCDLDSLFDLWVYHGGPVPGP
jgi:hypothetical protein